MAKSKLLKTFINNTTPPPSFLINNQTDVMKLAQSLLQKIDEKRSSVTAISRNNIEELSSKVHFSAIKHESKINTLFRLLGIPSEKYLESNEINFLDSHGTKINSSESLKKKLLEREYEQIIFSLNSGNINATSTSEFNKALDNAVATGKNLLSSLYDPRKINKYKLCPIIQFSSIASCVEAENRVSPVFASSSERFIDGKIIHAPFLETVLTIRLLPQSGGQDINDVGAVEELIISALSFALVTLSKQYNDNQMKAESLILSGIAKIRNSIVSSNGNPFVKSAEQNAGTREINGPAVESDSRQKAINDEKLLYNSIIDLIPLKNDVIPTGINLSGIPISTRNIEDNMLTSAFLEMLNLNHDALSRVTLENSKKIQKRQILQDKLTAEISSIIGNINDISVADMIITISALFLMDEEDLVGLIPKPRFDQITDSANNLSTSSSVSSSTSVPERQINIFKAIQKFKNNRTSTAASLNILQSIIIELYDHFISLLKRSHHI